MSECACSNSPSKGISCRLSAGRSAASTPAAGRSAFGGVSRAADRVERIGDAGADLGAAAGGDWGGDVAADPALRAGLRADPTARDRGALTVDFGLATSADFAALGATAPLPPAA